jgi:putative NADH-flavin reductase
MNLLIIGSSRGTGRALVDLALSQGHAVTALVRNPSKIKTTHDHLTIVKGDVLDSHSVDAAVMGKDAVLSTLGHKRWFIPTTILSQGTKNVITAMERHGVKRIVCETSLGVGDSRGKLGLYYTLFVIPFIIYFYYRDKEKQEQYIRESALDWVIVRPGQLTNGQKRGAYRHGLNVGNRLLTVSISRSDVADFMLKQVSDDTYLRSTPGVAY